MGKIRHVGATKKGHWEIIEKENKKVIAGQLDLYNYKLAEIAHELDKVNLNELTPIDALNTLVKLKEKLNQEILYKISKIELENIIQEIEKMQKMCYTYLVKAL